MSLESIVKNAALHLGRLARSTVDGAFAPFAIPTAIRKIDGTGTLLEYIGFQTGLMTTLPPLTIGGLFIPSVGITALVTNFFSGLYEKNEYRQLFTGEHNSIMEYLKKSVQEFPTQLRQALSMTSKLLFAYPVAFVLSGAIALSHYNLTYSLKPSAYDFSTVNLSIYNCTIELGKKKRNFTILGEVHLYNASSALVALSLIKSKRYSAFLSEGYDHKKVPKESKNAFTSLDVLPLIAIRMGAGLHFPNAEQIAQEINLPIHYLEHYEPTTGFQTGVSQETVEHMLTGLRSANIILPMFYFGSLPFRYTRIEFRGNPQKTDDELIHKRNRGMTKETISYLQLNKKSVPIIRVGSGHVAGMLKEFSQYGRFSSLDMTDIFSCEKGEFEFPSL